MMGTGMEDEHAEAVPDISAPFIALFGDDGVGDLDEAFGHEGVDLFLGEDFGFLVGEKFGDGGHSGESECLRAVVGS